MAESYLADTNVLVRFFTGDPPAQARKAQALVAAADAGEIELEIFPLILAEIVYTLESFYGMDRREVVEGLQRFIASRGVRAHERERVVDALERHARHNVHFADDYLAAAGAELDRRVASFDRDFDKFKDVKRVEPA